MVQNLETLVRGEVRLGDLRALEDSGNGGNRASRMMHKTGRLVYGANEEKKMRFGKHSRLLSNI